MERQIMEMNEKADEFFFFAQRPSWAKSAIAGAKAIRPLPGQRLGLPTGESCPGGKKKILFHPCLRPHNQATNGAVVKKIRSFIREDGGEDYSGQAGNPGGRRGSIPRS